VRPFIICPAQCGPAPVGEAVVSCPTQFGPGPRSNISSQLSSLVWTRSSTVGKTRSLFFQCEPDLVGNSSG
jgi:hypothetical protein